MSSRRQALARIATTTGLGLFALGAPGLARQADPPGGAVRARRQLGDRGALHGAEMAKLLGQSVFVDNKPGAAGNIAMQEVARATSTR